MRTNNARAQFVKLARNKNSNMNDGSDDNDNDDDDGYWIVYEQKQQQKILTIFVYLFSTCQYIKYSRQRILIQHTHTPADPGTQPHRSLSSLFNSPPSFFFVVVLSRLRPLGPMTTQTAIMRLPLSLPFVHNTRASIRQPTMFYVLTLFGRVWHRRSSTQNGVWELRHEQNNNVESLITIIVIVRCHHCCCC